MSEDKHRVDDNYDGKPKIRPSIAAQNVKACEVPAAMILREAVS